MTIHEKIHRSNGNVFEDLGVAHPDRAAARAAVMSRVSEVLRARGLTQRHAAQVLGLPQSKVSCLMNGKLSMFSLDHLFEVLNKLEKNVEIVITSKAFAEPQATTRVVLGLPKILQDDQEALVALSKRLSPPERLAAFVRHSRLVAKVYQAGVKRRSSLR